LRQSKGDGKVSRILLISNRSPLTGIGNYSYQLVKHIKETKLVDFDFINLATIAEDSFGGSVNVFSQKTKRLIDHLLFLRKIPRRYQLYHLLNPNLGVLAAKYRPIIITVHDIFPFTPIASHDLITQSYGLDIPIFLAMKVNMKFVKNADRLLSVSEHTKKDLVSLLKINASKITVTYPGVDRKLFQPRNQKEARQSLSLPLHQKIVLHVGVDEPRKNVKTLIHAFHLVKKRIPEAILVRIGGMRNTTRRLISSLRLEESVIHYRKVPNVALFYNASDLFVFPSYYEGFGLPVLEAMASGVPVIAGESSSIPEILGNAGMLVSPHDAEMLSECICQVLTDKKAREEMIARGLERSLKFNWKTCAEKTIEVYRTLCD
jgi:glycosyltransferase involved in cell wall biosynthesis